MATKKKAGNKGGGTGYVTVKPKKDTLAKNVGGNAHMGSEYSADDGGNRVKKTGGKSGK